MRTLGIIILGFILLPVGWADEPKSEEFQQDGFDRFEIRKSIIEKIDGAPRGSQRFKRIRHIRHELGIIVVEDEVNRDGSTLQIRREKQIAYLDSQILFKGGEDTLNSFLAAFPDSYLLKRIGPGVYLLQVGSENPRDFMKRAIDFKSNLFLNQLVKPN